MTRSEAIKIIGCTRSQFIHALEISEWGSGGGNYIEYNHQMIDLFKRYFASRAEWKKSIDALKSYGRKK